MPHGSGVSEKGIDSAIALAKKVMRITVDIPKSGSRRLFILSPARTDGKRAALVLNENAQFDIAKKLRSAEGVTIGELISFMSGLYFRGKLTYADRFASVPPKLHGVYVITSRYGLLPASSSLRIDDLKKLSEVTIDLNEPRYVNPFRLSAEKLREQLSNGNYEIVLLGSVATPKYVDILMQAFGERLFFPREFVGRGDMSRGGLLLRAVKNGDELEYVPIASEEKRRGARPPKLPRLINGLK